MTNKPIRENMTRGTVKKGVQKLQTVPAPKPTKPPPPPVAKKSK